MHRFILFIVKNKEFQKNYAQLIVFLQKKKKTDSSHHSCDEGKWIQNSKKHQIYQKYPMQLNLFFCFLQTCVITPQRLALTFFHFLRDFVQGSVIEAGCVLTFCQSFTNLDRVSRQVKISVIGLQVSYGTVSSSHTEALNKQLCRKEKSKAKEAVNNTDRR